MQYKSTHNSAFEKKSRERNEREQNLQEEYAKAKCIFETGPNERNANTLNWAKDTLELFYEGKIKGIIIRARARWHEHGEKKYEIYIFMNLEKRNHIKKHMRKLKYQWFHHHGSIQYL